MTVIILKISFVKKKFTRFYLFAHKQTLQAIIRAGVCGGEDFKRILNIIQGSIEQESVGFDNSVYKQQCVMCAWQSEYVMSHEHSIQFNPFNILRTLTSTYKDFFWQSMNIKGKFQCIQSQHVVIKLIELTWVIFHLC